MDGHVVGIGELLWDIYPDGRKVAGGAPFNFAFHCHQLGHEAVIVSRVGDDDLGKELREVVKGSGLSDAFVQTDYEHPTGTVRVTVDSKGQPTYRIAENVAWDRLIWSSPLRLLTDHSCAICYGSLALRYRVSRETIRAAISVTPGLRVFDFNYRDTLPPRSVLYDVVYASQWVKINIDEWTVLGGWIGFGGGNPAHQHAEHEIHDILWLVTHGSTGSEFFGTNDHFTEPAAPANVLDTVGAGDAFTAAMVCLHLEGRPLRACARFANHYAARVCEHVGATPKIDRAEVERAAFG